MTPKHTANKALSPAKRHSPLWNGVLLIDKTAGCTSHSVVDSLRKMIKQKEIGHAGTLDPIAEGLLLILLGYGTKLSDYLLTGNKRYLFTFRLGVTTDTLDKTGKILHQQKADLSDTAIQETLRTSQGKLPLPVPLFSAVKVRGKKLYEYVREQKPITPPKRDMFFYDLQFKTRQEDQVEVELSCHKGSYIRSWTSFVGEKLGTGACLEKLTRLSSHPFQLTQALKLEELEKHLNSPSPSLDSIPAFIPFSQALPHIPPIIISQHETQQLRHGQLPANLLYRLQTSQKETNRQKKENTLRAMNSQNSQMIALLKLRPFKSPKILKVFPPLLDNPPQNI